MAIKYIEEFKKRINGLSEFEYNERRIDILFEMVTDIIRDNDYETRNYCFSYRSEEPYLYSANENEEEIFGFRKNPYATISGKIELLALAKIGDECMKALSSLFSFHKNPNFKGSSGFRNTAHLNEIEVFYQELRKDNINYKSTSQYANSRKLYTDIKERYNNNIKKHLGNAERANDIIKLLNYESKMEFDNTAPELKVDPLSLIRRALERLSITKQLVSIRTDGNEELGRVTMTDKRNLEFEEAVFLIEFKDFLRHEFKIHEVNGLYYIKFSDLVYIVIEIREKKLRTKFKELYESEIYSLDSNDLGLPNPFVVLLEGQQVQIKFCRLNAAFFKRTNLTN